MCMIRGLPWHGHSQGTTAPRRHGSVGIRLQYASPRRRNSSESAAAYSTITRSVPPRPNVSGMYISSARGGGTTNVPGVVARATYS